MSSHFIISRYVPRGDENTTRNLRTMCRCRSSYEPAHAVPDDEDAMGVDSIFLRICRVKDKLNLGVSIFRRMLERKIALHSPRATVMHCKMAIFLWQSRQPQALRFDSASSKAIAVLPFQNAGSDKDTDFLRLALPDEIANTLSYVQSFSIRPFATTSKYSGPNLDLQQAGRDMGVTSIVTGHYLTEGNQLEVTLEAVDVANNRSVWRDTVAVATSDKIAMREQITARVRQGLVPALGGSSASGEAATRPKSEEAYDLYLRSIAVSHDVVPNKDAIAMLERAVGIDPTYAPAWDALGLRYYYDASYGDGGEQMLNRSDSALERAVALDPNLITASAELITNRTDRGEIRNAYAESSALVKRRPDSAQAHFTLSYVLRYVGSLDDAAREVRHCLEAGSGKLSIPFVRVDFQPIRSATEGNGVRPSPRWLGMGSKIDGFYSFGSGQTGRSTPSDSENIERSFKGS